MKDCVFQAPGTNRAPIWLSDDADSATVGEGICLKPGGQFRVDLDEKRLVKIDLKDLYFAGDYNGDKLVVAYIKEG